MTAIKIDGRYYDADSIRRLEALAIAGKRLADAVDAERDARRTQIGPHSASSERDAALAAFRALERGE